MQNSSLSKEISKVVNLFLEDEIQEFHFKLNMEISKEELDTMISGYDSSNGAIRDNIMVDEYIYDIDKNVFKKIIIIYIQLDNERVSILDIEGFTDFVN